MKRLLLILIACMAANSALAMKRSCGEGSSRNLEFELPDELLDPANYRPVDPLEIPPENYLDLGPVAAPSKRARIEPPIIDLEPDDVAGPSGAQAAGAAAAPGTVKPWPPVELVRVKAQAEIEFDQLGDEKQYFYAEDYNDPRTFMALPLAEFRRKTGQMGNFKSGLTITYKRTICCS